MLNQPQILRMLAKLKQLEQTMTPYIFKKIDTLPMIMAQTADRLTAPPADKALYTPATDGTVWGSEGTYCWFCGDYTVKPEQEGKTLFLMPNFGSYESMLFVDGVPFGTFANKITNVGLGNHYCDMIAMHPQAGQTLSIALEAYAGHYVIGCYPFEVSSFDNFSYTYHDVSICTKQQDIADFIFDLRALNQLASAMEQNSFRRADVINCLTEVHKIVCYSPENAPEEVWRVALADARAIMKPCLDAKNADSAAYCGLIGHSHMDTAWLWTIPETVKKCARTYANEISLMEQYPEYKFVQSSAYHLEMIRRFYPALFTKMQEKVKERRYEPNGAVWVECDCNITGGEAMIRQFLWGQRYTRKYFDFTSNCFWLPDTFGYSAAIPQIMKGCGVDYFLTTKLSWNDTNAFPYESFYWEGIDGSDVFVHFNTTHNWPDPETMINRTHGNGQGNSLQQKTVSNKRLLSYGFGDGGGGPQFEMIEMARRCADLDGCPKSEHIFVGDFMKDLEATAVRPNTYAGELYLELHRGTLTNQHVIKRNNRKAEIALRNLELLTVANAVRDGKIAADGDLHPLYETLLVNQFHDILPGTCISAANDQSHEEMAALLKTAKTLTKEATANVGNMDNVTVINPHGFVYDDILTLNEEFAVLDVDSGAQQHITDVSGNPRLVVAGVSIPAMSARTFGLKKEKPSQDTPFVLAGTHLTTPFAEIDFNQNGGICSMIDRANNRQLVKSGAFNTFLFAEDVPSAWDNWDVDADFQMKFRDCAVLLDRTVVSCGAVELRMRSNYRLSDKSTIKQDMVFYAHSPRIDFETIVDWNDKHHFLKVDFDTTILSRFARHDIQFGCVQKPTTRNTSVEQAMFEVLNHKYTDLSEPEYGIAILNDCKYGISVEGGRIGLSLHKGGCRPDPRGDQGVHRMTYSLLAHNGAYSGESVVKPAYMLNNPALAVQGTFPMSSLVCAKPANVIVEAVKPCEDNEKAFILRVYESTGSYTNADITFGIEPTALYQTNMLEEVQETLQNGKELQLAFKPFEIKTIKVCY